MKKKEYLFLILIVLILSFIFALPHLLIPKYLAGKPYYPLVLDGAPIFTSDELTWPAAEAREVMDGRLFPTDPVVWEHKVAPSLTAQIPAMIIGFLGRAIGSINTAYIVLGFILPPLVFLSIFFLVFLLTREYLISSLVSILIMTMTRPFQFVPPLNLSMLKMLFGYLGNHDIDPTPVEFFRLPNPLLIFPFFILTIIFLYLSLEKKKMIFAFVGGVFFGLLFYIYFYFWTFILAGVGIIFLASLIQKDWSRIKLLLIFIGIGGLTSLFYWINFYKFGQYPFQGDVLSRAGIEIGRIRNLYRTVQFLIFGFLFSLAVRKKDFKFWFLLFLLFGGIVCLNIQVITGYTFQSHHWTLRAINPWVMLMLGFFHFRLFSKKKFYQPLTLFLIIFFLGLGGWIQFSFARKAYSAYTLAEDKVAAFKWLNKNTSQDSVVGSLSVETNVLIPVYTHNNVFLPNGGVTLAPTEEMIQRICTVYKLFEIPLTFLDDILAYSEEREVQMQKNCLKDQCLKNRRLAFLEKAGAWFFFHMESTTWKETLTGWSYEIGIAEKRRRAIVEGYQKFLKIKGYLPAKLRLDYLFFGPEERKLSKVDLGQYDFLSLVYEQGEVEIYQVKKSAF